MKTKLSPKKYSGVLVFEVLAFEVLVIDFLKFFIFQILTLFRQSALADEMDCREKKKTKLSSKKYSGVLVFEVLAFEVLVIDFLKFFIFQILTLFRHSALATGMDGREKKENKAFV